MRSSRTDRLSSAPPPMMAAQASSQAANDFAALQGPAFDRVSVSGITLDPVGTKDRDDALWVDRYQDERILHMSIADVAALVPIGSQLDTEAFDLTSSRYLAGLAQSMFPREFADAFLSLHPEQERLTYTVSLPIANSLAIGTPHIELTRIKSQAHLSYAEVTAQLASSNQPWHAVLKDLREIALLLSAERQSRGALALCDPARGIMTTEEGLAQRVRAEHIQAQLIVRECMIVANQAVVEAFMADGFPAIFRNQIAKPAASRQELCDRLRQLHGVELSPDHEYFALLENMVGPAAYSSVNAGHFGLRLPAYLRVTSPLRSYVDLVNNRLLQNWLRAEEPCYSAEELERIAVHCNQQLHSQRDQTAAFFKERLSRVAGRLAGGAKFRRMSARSFSPVLLGMLLNGDGRPEFQTELLRRVQLRMLSTKDYYRLFFKGSDTPYWDLLRRQVARLLYKRSYGAAGLLDYASTKGRLAGVCYESRAAKTKHGDLVVWTRAIADCNGKRFAGAILGGATLEQARARSLSSAAASCGSFRPGAAAAALPHSGQSRH